MNLKLKKKMNHLLLLDVLIDDDDGLIIELGTFSKNIKKEVIKVIDSFFFVLMRYDERKTHIMLAFMVDPRFKSLIFFFLN